MKVYLRTFGCRANQYDTEAVRAMLETSGHTIVASAADADVAVFNSCAVTSDAEAELRKAVRRAARERPGASQHRHGLRRRARRRRGRVAQLRALPIGGRTWSAARICRRSPRALDLDADVAGVRHDAPDRERARCCAFRTAATSTARFARRRWRAARIAAAPADEIVREAAALAERHAEIVITGIHIGTYGADIGTSLGALMTRLVRDGADGALSAVVDRGDGARRRAASSCWPARPRTSRRTSMRRCSPGRTGCSGAWAGIGIRAPLIRAADRADWRRA